MNERIIIAIYFDLENIDRKLNVSALLDNIALQIEEEKQSVFAIKLACGHSESIGKFRNQLRDNNFEIREAPNVSKNNLKNRADLILSLEAFETLVHNKPDIDLYVFITSDTDFTVVMDKLRKYGRQVWLVTSENTLNNKLFSNSSDNIINLNDSFSESQEIIKKKTREGYLVINGFSKEHQRGIMQVLDSFEKDAWNPYSMFGIKMRNLFKDFSYKGKEFYSQTRLFKFLSENNIIETERRGKLHYFRVK